VIGVLKAAFVQERLTKDEFDTRVGHALISRTRTDLTALTADLSWPASSRPGSPLRTAATVAALVSALVVVLGGLLALDAWNEQRTDGALTASYAAGIAVSSDTRLGVTAQAAGPPGAPCCDLVWRIGAHPELLAHFAGAAPLAFAPGSHTLLAASPTGVTEWSLANPARPVPMASMSGPGAAAGIAYAPGHPMVAVAYPTAVQLWDVTRPATPHLIATIPVAAHVTGPMPYSSVQEQIAFSPDGRTLATTAAGHAVSLWDVSTPTAPRHLATVGPDTGPIAALAFSPPGSQLAYLGQNGQLTVVALTDPAHPVHAAIPFPAATLAQWGNYELAYSPDGTRLTAVVLIEETGGPRIICTWNTTSLSRPLAVHCRTDQFPSTGAFTFIANGTAIVGPDPRGANQLSDTLSIWPPLPA
jgi:WD40 repeat protein